MTRLMLVLGLLVSAQLLAQEDLDLRVDVKRFQWETVKWDDIYPQLNLRGIGARGDEWGRLAINFEINDNKADRRADVWIDELTFNWNVVVALGRDGGTSRPNPNSSLRFTRDITYVNVKTSSRGNEYWAMLFIPPEMLERFGSRLPDNQVLGRVSITHGRKLITSMFFAGSNFQMTDRAPSSAHRDYVLSEDPIPLNYGLFNRLETPWGYAGSGSGKLMRILPAGARQD